MHNKHDDMSEALMRRRHEYAKKHVAPQGHDGYAKQPPANQGAHQVAPGEAEALNRGQGEMAPNGATPEGMPGEPDADDMVLTPAKFMEGMGSANAGGLRARVMQHAEEMKKHAAKK